MSSIAAIVALAMVPQGSGLHDHEAITCLALNIYHEARGETLEGQVSVAQVTLNRRDHPYWPDTVCEVVYDKGQFDWVHRKADHIPHEKDLYKRIERIAYEVMYSNVVDPTQGSVFYHATRLNSDSISWVSYMDESHTIGNHLFYTWDGDWSK